MIRIWLVERITKWEIVLVLILVLLYIVFYIIILEIRKKVNQFIFYLLVYVDDYKHEFMAMCVVMPCFYFFY